jgi:hypothetical protein
MCVQLSFLSIMNKFLFLLAARHSNRVTANFSRYFLFCAPKARFCIPEVTVGPGLAQLIEDARISV